MEESGFLEGNYLMKFILSENQKRLDKEELDRLKMTVKVVDMATALYGYAVDRKESIGQTTVLRREADNSKLLVRQGRHGWDEYKNLRTEAQGSVLDFVQAEQGCRLGQARQLLRQWLRTDRPQDKDYRPTAIAAAATGDNATADEPDRKRVKAILDAADWIPAPAYLSARGLSASLADDRFTGCYRTNRNGVVMFPHRDHGGLSGYELRGIGADGERLKRFSKRGKNGLWASRNVATASLVVIVESAIDALSHGELFADWQAGYVSFAGEISFRQKPLLTGLINKAASRNVMIIVAVDNDRGGSKHFKTLCGLTSHKLERMKPISKDWNDDLMYCVKENR